MLIPRIIKYSQVVCGWYIGISEWTLHWLRNPCRWYDVGGPQLKLEIGVKFVHYSP
jgi:uncharacterized protein YodC (DUF2158 family)